MATVFDYLKWRGDLSFSLDPLNPVDGLIFSVLSYIPFVGQAAETASVTRQMGRMMVIEEGNTSDSSSGVRRVSRGTSTMPPPAPNSPATAPAARPESAMPSQLFFFIANTTPWKFFHGVRFYAASGECALERRKNANL